MQRFIERSIEAHGGLERWDQLRSLSVTLVPDGLSLRRRGQAAFAGTPTRVTIDTRRQRTRFDPFLAPGRIGLFEPDRTAVETSDGTLVESLNDPRASFTSPDAPWSALQLAYFAGYAMWTYLTLPFSLRTDGMGFEDAGSWTEDGETWRVIKVTFPPSYATHSSEQALYFDDRGRLRRQDYSVDIAAGGKAAHYLHDYEEFGGLVFPTRRRIHPRAFDGTPDKEIVIMSADLSDFELS